MSQWPREYRRILLTKKLFTGDPWKDGLMDVQDASNRKKAIKETLDKQDREYQQRQHDKVNEYKKRLEEL